MKGLKARLLWFAVKARDRRAGRDSGRCAGMGSSPSVGCCAAARRIAWVADSRGLHRVAAGLRATGLRVEVDEPGPGTQEVPPALCMKPPCARPAWMGPPRCSLDAVRALWPVAAQRGR